MVSAPSAIRVRSSGNSVNLRLSPAPERDFEMTCLPLTKPSMRRSPQAMPSFGAIERDEIEDEGRIGEVLELLAIRIQVLR